MQGANLFSVPRAMGALKCIYAEANEQTRSRALGQQGVK